MQPDNIGSHQPLVFNIPADPIDRLPALAAVKFRFLRETALAARASLREIVDRQNSFRAEKHDAERWIERRRREFGESEVGIREKDRLAKAVRELEQLQPFHDARATVAEAVGGLIQDVEAWLRQLPLDATITAYAGTVKVPKSAPARIVEQARHRLVELAEQRDRVSRAPLPAAEAKNLAREQVAALAKRGAPNINRLFIRDAFDGSRAIQWPIASVDVSHYRRASDANGVVTDELGLLAWLEPDKLIARLEAEIDQCADDGNALTEYQREARLAEIAAEALDTERTEEAAIEAAEADGLHIHRRRAADPRAVLGLASDLPAPEQI